jgi:transposase
MNSAYVTDELWTVVAPLLPPPTPKPKGGRPRLDDRAALNGIVFVLVTGIGWERLPSELGFGSGMTCWRRLRDWHKAGVWKRLHHTLLERLSHADQIDWSRVCVDASTVRAPKGGTRRAKTRLTAARPEASTISLPTGKAFRW